MTAETSLDIVVTPRSSRRKIVITDADTVRVYLNAPPAEGKANAQCIDLFSETLGVPRSSISLDKGSRGRKKRLVIRGLSREELLAILRKTQS